MQDRQGGAALEGLYHPHIYVTRPTSEPLHCMTVRVHNTPSLCSEWRYDRLRGYYHTLFELSGR